MGLYDPDRAGQFKPDVIASTHRCFDADHPYAGHLVMDDFDTANQMLQYVRIVLFRYYQYDHNWQPSRMTDLSSAYAYAEEIWHGWESVRAQLTPYLIVNGVRHQTVIPASCELDNPEWSGAFYLRWMQLDDADGRGYKSGIFTDSPWQPNVSALATRLDAYRYAMAHGHWYVVHDYGLGGTGEIAYWRKLYAAMPADCRPRILVGEAGRANGLYIDAP